MKTYNLIYACMAMLIVIGCSKTDSDSLGEKEKEEEKNIQSDYTLLVNNNGMLEATLLNLEDNGLALSGKESKFSSVSQPTLSYENDQVLTMYHKKSDCSGEITVYDFKDDTSEAYEVFTDLGACSLTAKAVSRKGNTIYIAYELHVSPSAEDDEFYVRALDVSVATPTYVDITLDKRPLQLAFAHNRLFVLTLDEEVTDEYAISVVDSSSNTEIYDTLVGFDVRRMFTGPDDNIIIGYDDLHSTINSTTFEIKYTNYGSGKEPNFTGSSYLHFDSSGKMYYEMTPTDYSEFPVIPAVYDFEENLTVMYAFENFITETQLKFEYEIEKTTMVSYDEENNVLLIGYKKKTGDDKGGLLRLNPAPKPQVLNNIDVDGIPTTIFIK
ncbi:hypothetical protein [Zobellia galactanivorans]|uniref:Conserved hypothetical lipoprotein n=1 Tax=Zobellia galactanivorans (strain DSM 12802 / CCUG 47099 / CIP 106680 / NCIMB 13871 / Dsij) TaxID=63186 RepID=G0L4R9_ZOBGA|nr:hypothetical protein [Zobellia galactanivorans]CAZ98864.1 Conserved hypothetical lipoprotein [Zobellia galactanivorans]